MFMVVRPNDSGPGRALRGFAKSLDDVFAMQAQVAKVTVSHVSGSLCPKPATPSFCWFAERVHPAGTKVKNTTSWMSPSRHL